jgi:cytochrome c5
MQWLRTKAILVPQKTKEADRVLCHTLQDSHFTNAGATMFPKATLEADLGTFYDLMADEIDTMALSRGTKGRFTFFTEVAPLNAPRIAFLNFDFLLRRDGVGQAPATDLLRDVAALCARTVTHMLYSAESDEEAAARRGAGEEWPLTTQCVVALCPTQQRPDGTIKCGMQLYWPHLVLTEARHTRLCHKLQDTLNAHFGKRVLVRGDSAFVVLDSWDRVVDVKYVKKGALRMLGNAALEECKCAQVAAAAAAGAEAKGGEEEEEDTCATKHFAPKRKPPKSRAAAKERKWGLRAGSRYMLHHVLSGTGLVDAAATEFYRAHTKELLQAISLCVPRALPPNGDALRDGLPADYVSKLLGDEAEADACGAEDVTAEEGVKWTPLEYDPQRALYVEGDKKEDSPISHAFMQVALSIRPVGSRARPDSGPLHDILDFSTLSTATVERQRFYRVHLAPGFPCPNNGMRPHRTERMYLLHCRGSMHVTLRCGCKCKSVEGRVAWGDRPPVRCAMFCRVYALTYEQHCMLMYAKQKPPPVQREPPLQEWYIAMLASLPPSPPGVPKDAAFSIAEALRIDALRNLFTERKVNKRAEAGRELLAMAGTQNLDPSDRLQRYQERQPVGRGGGGQKRPFPD